MKNEEYWADRAAWNLYESMERAEETAKAISNVYFTASRWLQLRMEDIFEKFQTKYGLSEEEARRLLFALKDEFSAEELVQALKSAASQKDKEKLLSQLEAPAYQARIQRLMELQMQIDQVMQQVYKQEEVRSTAFYEELAREAYYRSIFEMQKQTGLAFTFHHISPRQIDRTLAANWSGMHYSERIWKNTQALANALREELLVSLLTGRTERETAEVIAYRFSQAAWKARRLVRTESAYVCGEMTGQSYEDCEVERYRYLATLDLKTSETCRELDGKEFPVSSRQAGKNYPPMHPWCRSTTICVLSEEDLERFRRSAYNPKTGRVEQVPLKMTYAEWYRKYVEGSSEAQAQEKAEKNRSEDRKKQLSGQQKNVQNSFRYPIDEDMFQSFAMPRSDGKNIDIQRPRNIIKALNKNQIGKNAYSYIKKKKIPVYMLYNVDNPEGLSGMYDPIDKSICIYADKTKTISESAKTIIHEAMHDRLGHKGTKKEEALCFLEEMKYEGVKLTPELIRGIIKSINHSDLYRDLPWR